MLRLFQSYPINYLGQVLIDCIEIVDIQKINPCNNIVRIFMVLCPVWYNDKKPKFYNQPIREPTIIDS